MQVSKVDRIPVHRSDRSNEYRYAEVIDLQYTSVKLKDLSIKDLENTENYTGVKLKIIFYKYSGVKDPCMQTLKN